MLSLPDEGDSSHHFYNYTSGAWLYNDQVRRQERRLIFDIAALLDAASRSVGTSSESVTNMTKIAEGGYYRVFEITLRSSPTVIARLPYPCTIPRKFGVASEVATMQYLRLKDIPIPEVLDWSSSLSPVRSEYILMAKAQGSELEQTWYTMTIEERSSVMKQIVCLEDKLFQLEFPVNGSTGEEEEFCLGPSTELLWWYKDRDLLNVNRGPWTTATDAMKSVGERELAWLERFGEPRYPREVMYREFYNKKKVDPAVQMQSLRDYLTLAPAIIPDDADLIKPTIRHPDLSPSNIFVSDSGDITALLD
ncbi:hypothetical protein MBLNU459_g7627t1 [Dothideomycetes sp. NU459]